MSSLLEARDQVCTLELKIEGLILEARNLRKRLADGGRMLDLFSKKLKAENRRLGTRG